MEPTSTRQTLNDRLKAKMDEDREQIEALTSQALHELAESLKRQSHDVLSTTVADIRQRTLPIAAEVEGLIRIALERALAPIEEAQRQAASLPQEIPVLAQQVAEQVATELRASVSQALAPLQQAETRTAGITQGLQRQADRAQAALVQTDRTLKQLQGQIEASARLTRLTLARATAIPLGVGLLILLGIFAGSWGMMRYQLTEIRRQGREITEQQHLLGRLPKGVELSHFQDGTPVLLLPQGVQLQMCNDNRPCLSIPR